MCSAVLVCEAFFCLSQGSFRFTMPISLDCAAEFEQYLVAVFVSLKLLDVLKVTAFLASRTR